MCDIIKWSPLTAINTTEYEISSCGIVRRVDSQEPIRVYFNGGGYPTVRLQNRWFLLHRLVAMTFIPCINMEKLEINHKDGNKNNICVDGLEWCTRSENAQHAFATGLNHSNSTGWHIRTDGEFNGRAKLSRKDVDNIRAAYAKRRVIHTTIYTLADQYDVTPTMISNIVRYKNWK